MTEVKPTPIYVLGVLPDKSLNIKGFFEYGEGSFRWLLEHPTSLRNYGWDLETLDRSKIVEGIWIEVNNGERKKIQLTKDGFLIMAAYADDTFLGWGKDPDEFLQNPQINTLALIEVTFNFVEFYREFLSKLEDKPNSVKFSWDLKNLFLSSGSKCYLTPHEVNSPWYRSVDDAKKAPNAQKNWSYEHKIDAGGGIYDSELVAYKIIEEMFLWFGIHPEKIPYTKVVDGTRLIDTGKIKII
jgi:hypothetical protein